MNKPKRFWNSWWFAISFVLGLMIIPVVIFIGIMVAWYFSGPNATPGP